MICASGPRALTLGQQINLLTYMASTLNTIGYHRKSAWIMYESVNRMFPLLIQGRANLAGARDTKKDLGRNDSGILDVLKRVCEIYGLGGNVKYRDWWQDILKGYTEQNVHDGGALEVLQDREKEHKEESGVRGAVAKERLRFGWPELQIDILRQCIAITEALPGKDER